VRALVTGSAGFVGRHMVKALTSHGWQVDGCDLRHARTAWRVNALDVFAARVEHYRHVYDLVVHCAYHVGGRAAIDGKPSYLALNLQLDASLFAWATRTGQQRVLYFSSSAAYPVYLQTRQNAMMGTRLSEDDISLDAVEQPDARYGWAKLTGERLAQAAAESGLAVHVVRPFSGYGSEQDLCYPFPAIVQRVRDRGDLSVWGPPGQSRDWIHIDDVVGGALAVVDADERRPVNLCTGEATEFGVLANKIAVAARRRAQKVTYLQDRPTGVAYRIGDPTRMRTLYQPLVTLDEGIARALAEVPPA
jgi:nucleoside-diphosphate-sugar epimerase